MHDLLIEPTKAFADIVLRNDGPLEQLSAIVQIGLNARPETGPVGLETYQFRADQTDIRTRPRGSRSVEGRL